MRAAMDLFAGQGSANTLNMAGGERGGAATSSSSSGEQAKAGRQHGHDRFYADLYLALWHEAAEESDDTARVWMGQAIDSPYAASGDYMWHLAAVHAAHRGWAAGQESSGRMKADL
jgi:hypothetical protein